MISFNAPYIAPNYYSRWCLFLSDPSSCTVVGVRLSSGMSVHRPVRPPPQTGWLSWPAPNSHPENTRMTGQWVPFQYDDVTMGAIASQITSLTIVYSTVYSGVDQSKHQGSASLAFVWGIHRGPVNSPHTWPVTRKCVHLMTSSCSSLLFNDDRSAGSTIILHSRMAGLWCPTLSLGVIARG